MTTEWGKGITLGDAFKFVSQKLEGTDSLVWAGIPALGLWYYCAKCVNAYLMNPAARRPQRVRIGARFCEECGAALTWPRIREVQR